MYMVAGQRLTSWLKTQVASIKVGRQILLWFDGKIVVLTHCVNYRNLPSSKKFRQTNYLVTLTKFFPKKLWGKISKFPHGTVTIFSQKFCGINSISFRLGTIFHEIISKYLVRLKYCNERSMQCWMLKNQKYTVNLKNIPSNQFIVWFIRENVVYTKYLKKNRDTTWH